jgi:hypothetical protein
MKSKTQRAEVTRLRKHAQDVASLAGLLGNSKWPAVAKDLRAGAATKAATRKSPRAFLKRHGIRVPPNVTVKMRWSGAPGGAPTPPIRFCVDVELRLTTPFGMILFTYHLSETGWGVGPCPREPT